MQRDGWTTNRSHQMSSFLNQMANICPDPGREQKSQMYCFGSVGIRWWLCCQKQATEAPQKFEQLEPYLSLPSSLRRKFCPHTCPPLEEGQGIQHMKLPPRRKACNYHLSIKLLQFVCLLTGTLNGLESTFNTVQPVLTVGLLKGNNVTARTRQRLTACTRVSIQQHSLTYNQPSLVTDCYITKNPNTWSQITELCICWALKVSFIHLVFNRESISKLHPKIPFLFNGISTCIVFQILSAPDHLLIMLIKCLKGKTIARFIKEKALHCKEILLQQTLKDNRLTERERKRYKTQSSLQAGTKTKVTSTYSEISSQQNCSKRVCFCQHKTGFKASSHQQGSILREAEPWMLCSTYPLSYHLSQRKINHQFL